VIRQHPYAIQSWAGYDMRTVRSSASAAVGVVTESVDVHATLSVGIVASNVP
jgi:hypothetical protein